MIDQKEITETLALVFKISAKVKEKIKVGSQKKGHDNVSFLHLRTLRFVVDKGEPTMKDIADYFAITPPSATALVDICVKEGQLERIFDKKDRRIVRLAITAKGQRILKNGSETMTEIFTELLSNLNEGQIKEFKEILNIIVNK